MRHLGDGDSDARLVHHDVVLHSGGEVVADVGRQGVVLAVPGLLLLHVAERARADPDLGSIVIVRLILLDKSGYPLQPLPAEDVALPVLQTEHEADGSPGEAAVTRAQAHELVDQGEVVTPRGCLLTMNRNKLFKTLSPAHPDPGDHGEPPADLVSLVAGLGLERPHQVAHHGLRHPAVAGVPGGGVDRTSAITK